MSFVVVGHSHLKALQVAASEGHAAQADFLQLRDEPYASMLRKTRPKDGVLPTPLAKRIFSPKNDAVVLYVQGNAHNLFGLVNHPQPFDFLMPGTNAPDIPGRPIAPYALVRAGIEEAMGRQLKLLNVLVQARQAAASKSPFPILRRWREKQSQRFFLLMAPPPVPEDHALRYSGRFRGAIERHGISPMSFRRKCWQVQRDIISKWAEQRNVAFIDVPARVFSYDGALRLEYCGQDTTHANAAYGHVVLNLLKDVVFAGQADR